MKKHTYLLALLLLLLISSINQSFAQCTYTTVKSGNFNDPTVYAVTGGGGCTQGSLPTSSSTIVLNHAVTLNQNFTVGNGGTLLINSTGSLTQDATSRQLTIDRGTLNIAAVTSRSVARLKVGVLQLDRTTAVTIGANSAIQLGCLYFENQTGLTLNSNSLLDISGNVNVSTGNPTITSPTTAPAAGIRVTGNFTGAGGGTNNIYNATNIISCVQQLPVSNCPLSGNVQSPPANNDPSCFSVLPVTLVQFTGSRQANGVRLSWATSMEKNNAYFEVQRSTDGQQFSTIGRVAGQGTSATGGTYELVDYPSAAGLVYYRLRQVDTDGTATLSSVVVVSTTDDLQAAFYPNPSNSTITLPSVEGIVEYRVYSLTGQVLLAGQAAGNASVAVHTIPAGVYILELTSGGKRNVQRFARQ